MSDKSTKKPVPYFSTPVGTVTAAVLFWVLACVLAAAAIIALGKIDFADTQTELLIRYLAFAPSTIAIVLSVVFLIVGSVRWALFGKNALPGVTVNLTRELATLESINQRLLLSETAKKINYRAEDIAVLRRTLQHDIKKGEYDAAMVLVVELGSNYGQLHEAEQFREQIDQARMEEQETKIAEGVKRFEKLLAEHDFPAATRESARLKRLFPESATVETLPGRVEVAKEQYKHELERAFLHASEREEVDRAMDIMTVLDKLLTPEEAEQFQEVARGVIGKKRDNLGVQFKLAVHDRDWIQAVAAGEQIIQQFPNTRMADEVRQRIDQLRANAGTQTTATKTPPPNTGISFTAVE